MEKSIKNMSDDDILSNSLRFAFTKCPIDENGALKDFQKYKKTFYGCVKWLRENYEPACEGFLEESVNK